MKITREMNSTFNIIGPLLFLFFLLHVTTVKAQEVEEESEFNYEQNSDKGPSRWGDIKAEWAACKNGKLQSPVDLSEHRRLKIVSKTGMVTMHYKPSNTILRNRGHDIQLQWDCDAGSIQIEGIEYNLKQAHWHSPSEHTIDGRRYDLELHVVHQNNEKNKIAVIAVLYKTGGPDPFLSNLMRNISSMVDEDDVIKTNPGLLDPNEIDISGKSFYRYTGSLTTPPCTEGVIWTVENEIKMVSRDQVKLLQEAVHDSAEMNARPLQQLNGREVNLYTPIKKRD